MLYARKKPSTKSVSPHGQVKLIYSKPGYSPVISQPSDIASIAFAMHVKCPKSEWRFREALKRFEPDGIYFQHSVTLLGYIPDFYCAERKLIIEIDGPHHKDRWREDNARDIVFLKAGITTHRFPAWRVFYQLEELMEDIESILYRNANQATEKQKP